MIETGEFRQYSAGSTYGVALLVLGAVSPDVARAQACDEAKQRIYR